MLKRLLLLFGCCFAFFGLHAQGYGALRAEIIPANAFLRVQGQVYDLSQQKASISLPAGTHIIEIWASQFAIFTDTIVITEGETLSYAKGLPKLSDTFEQYRTELASYNYTVIRNTARVGSIIAGNVLLTVGILQSNRGNVKRLREQGEALARSYEIAFSPEDIARFRSSYEITQQKHSDALALHQTIRKIGIPVMLVSYGVSTYYFIYRARHRPVKPVYEEGNPFLGFIHKFSPSLYCNNKSVQAGILLNF